MDNFKKIPLLSFQKILFLILPVSLIFSIFVADLIVSILFLIFFYYILKNKDFKILNNFYFKFFFCFWVYIVCLSFFSSDFIVSIKSSFFYLRFITLPLSIYLLFYFDKNIKKYFFWILGSILVVLYCDSFFQIITGKNVMGYGIIDNRVSSFFEEEKILGSYISRIFFIFAGLWFTYYHVNNTRKNFIFIIFLALSLITIIISGDRMPLLVFLICIFILFFSIKIKLKFRTIYLTILSLIICLPIIFSQSVYDRLIKRTLLEFGSEKGLVEGSRFYQIELENDKKIKMFTQQQNFFFTSVNMIKSKFVFGHSNKGYKINCSKFALDKHSCPSHPHNTYLQIFVENGLVGFMFILSIFFYFTYLLIKNFKNLIFNKSILNISEICFILAVYLNLWPLVQTGNFYNNWLSIIYYLPVVFLLNNNNLIKKLNI